MILGPTGRNFGAGMSGGIAYVYDRDGDFAGKVNHEMVELEGLDSDDLAFVRDRIEAHLRETESDLARHLLQDWGTTVTRFVKVMPSDFKRVMKAAREAEERGVPVLDAIMAAAHG